MPKRTSLIMPTGMADERWHDLLRTLSARDLSDLDRAFHRIRAYGATSGIDMLQGFTRTLQVLRRSE